MELFSIRIQRTFQLVSTHLAGWRCASVVESLTNYQPIMTGF